MSRDSKASNKAKSEYYKISYTDVQRRGIQGWGNSLVDRLVEKSGDQSPNDKVLEIGASSGEHFRFVRVKPIHGTYIALDLNPGLSNPSLARKYEKTGQITFVSANAEDIPFPDNFFDRTVSMCVLAHVDNPEKVLIELRRVTKPGGTITIGMPTDPGIFNRLIKTIITYPKLRKSGVSNPELLYSREHVNGINNLLVLIRHVFEAEMLKFLFFPFRLHSWNFNLAIVAKITIKN